MDDIDVAYLVLATAAAADGGCVPCMRGCIDTAIYENPTLPYEAALKMLRPSSAQRELRTALASARASWCDGALAGSLEGSKPKVVFLDDVGLG